MPNEFRVIIERELPSEVLHEIDQAIKSAVLEKIAKLDFTEGFSVSRLAKDFGGGHTAGLLLK